MEDRRNVLRLGLALPFLGLPTALLAEAGAKYFEAPQTEWLPGSSRMRLLRDFRYRDPQGLMWTAKKGALVDGASIPRLAWTIAGSPYDPPYREASVIHDYYCDTMLRSWEATHRVFLDAMLTSGTEKVEAGSKWWAVHRAGPRWDDTYRWSGLWPFRVRRPDRPPANPEPSPPPPTVEQAAAWQKAQREVDALAEQQFRDVRAGLASGTLSVDDLPALADEQIARQPTG
ncbi:DUF1353 domain-containing protein [Sphingomonas yantingensis]|jgi:hypothetical protein|uniref:DUF1353 domain-containing protein n=1 Tax=Sphingomonas yantingensis TaxID=1241761 RepID=A0A7W9ARL8_9SPHN|nr:DUF1353 domain-containing protein [Sphingomonas yantingensis]MBB5699157.1 hypothetical protein [Sphingomonas yantingensis]